MIRSLIVDDEPVAREILERYINETPHLELSGSCTHGVEALSFLENEPVDLIFLDINMPELSGLDLARALKDSPCIVFTTAYPEYAVEGFEVEAIDYLVKPIAFDRFLQAVNKVKKKLEESPDRKSNLWIKADKKLYRVPFDSIRYIESMGDYLKIHTDEEVLVTHETMKNIEKKLPGTQFMRIHKSYTVSTSAVKYIEGNSLKVDGKTLTVGATNREEVMKRLK